MPGRPGRIGARATCDASGNGQVGAGPCPSRNCPAPLLRATACGGSLDSWRRAFARLRRAPQAVSAGGCVRWPPGRAGGSGGHGAYPRTSWRRFTGWRRWSPASPRRRRSSRRSPRRPESSFTSIARTWWSTSRMRRRWWSGPGTCEGRRRRSARGCRWTGTTSLSACSARIGRSASTSTATPEAQSPGTPAPWGSARRSVLRFWSGDGSGGPWPSGPPGRSRCRREQSSVSGRSPIWSPWRSRTPRRDGNWNKSPPSRRRWAGSRRSSPRPSRRATSSPRSPPRSRGCSAFRSSGSSATRGKAL